MMLTQKAIAFGPNEGYLPPHHFDQVFTAHGVIMIFFFAMPLITGDELHHAAADRRPRRRLPVPEQLQFLDDGAGGAITMPPCSSASSPAPDGWRIRRCQARLQSGVGVDYYIWGLQVAGVGTTLSGINLIATIVKMRAPGMTMMKLPVFTWTTLCANVLIVAAFPVLTATLAMLVARPLRGNAFLHERSRRQPDDVHQPDLDLGPPGGVYPDPAGLRHLLEVVSTFCGKRLFGYASMVYATVVITILSYLVWLHHFFTMGSGPA